MVIENQWLYSSYKAKKNIDNSYCLIGARSFSATKIIAHFIDSLQVPIIYEDFLKKIAADFQTSITEVKPFVDAFLERMLKNKVVIYTDTPEVKPILKLTEGTLLDDRYTILDCISQKRNKHIYIAQDYLTGKKVVIRLLCTPKLNINSHNNHYVVRFEQEFEKVKAIGKHKNICQYLHFEKSDGVYMVLEYIEGKTLKQISKENNQSFVQRMEWTAQILDVLAFLHQQGVLHGDLHSSNFLLDSNKNIKLIDFEFTYSQKIDNEIKVSGGVYQYLPPERIKEHKNQIFANNQINNTQSEVFQIGIILYFLFAGKLPFEALTWKELSNKIINQNPLPIFDFAEKLSNSLLEQEIESLIFRCLSKQAELRPFSAKEVLLEWENIQKDVNHK